ncbi:MAG: ComEA family DNA-binding protein [Spirulinaceae cyanobacterium]
MLQDPYYRLESVAEIEVAASLGIKIDVNQASVDDWLRLPGISIHQGRSLVELTNMGVQLLCLEDIASAISLPLQRIQPWEPLLYFGYYEPENVLNPQKVNPNKASFEQLSQIPLLETSLAQKIIQSRLAEGSYRNLADLQSRLNLDSEFISQLMYYLQF